MDIENKKYNNMGNEKVLDEINDNSESENNDEPKYVIDIIPSANKLKAYLRVRSVKSDSDIKPEEIFKYLKNLDIVYGIQKDEIIEYCENKNYIRELVVAKGLDPKNEVNAKLVYNFDTDNTIKFKEKDDGSIDFKSMENIRKVHKDDVICYKVPIEQGSCGVDIYGNEVLYSKAKDVSLPAGKNTYISEDELSLLSSVDGCINMRGNFLDVENVYTVDSVDHSTGNIDFVGSVIVRGDVRSGFTVKAKENITVKGMVESSVLEAGGDITISNGMNGRGKGRIETKGNVTSKYLENCTVHSSKNVYSDAIINSEVVAGENIILKGMRGALIGGKCTAGKVLYAKAIGTKNNLKTTIDIDLGKFLNYQNEKAKNDKIIEQLETSLESREKELVEIEKKAKSLLPYVKKSPENEKMYKLNIIKKVQVTKEISNLKSKIIEHQAENNMISDFKVICTGIIYANTKISIGWIKYIAREDLSYSKLYNDGSDIKIVQLLPSDVNMEV